MSPKNAIVYAFALVYLLQFFQFVLQNLFRFEQVFPPLGVMFTHTQFDELLSDPAWTINDTTGLLKFACHAPQRTPTMVYCLDVLIRGYFDFLKLCFSGAGCHLYWQTDLDFATAQSEYWSKWRREYVVHICVFESNFKISVGCERMLSQARKHRDAQRALARLAVICRVFKASIRPRLMFIKDVVHALHRGVTLLVCNVLLCNYLARSIISIV
jgi:hypothetical protein